MAMQPMHKPSMMGAAVIALVLIVLYHVAIGRKSH